MGLTGGQLAGGNPESGRSEYDYYATNPADVKALLSALHRDNISFSGSKFLEPCAGGGHIVEACKGHKYMPHDSSWTTCDIIDRGYPLDIHDDFLVHNFTDTYDGIITNPPFTYASEFIERCIGLLNDKGILAVFLKVQFLEGERRRDLFDRFPPKYVYVMRYRAQPWADGSPFNPKTGKEWGSTICFCWYIWFKGSTSEPIIRWVDETSSAGKQKQLF